jgi:hypothetical protein
MAGAAFLCRQRMGETITAGGLVFSGSESVASGDVNGDTVVAGVVPRLAGVAFHLGGMLYGGHKVKGDAINANRWLNESNQQTLEIERYCGCHDL